jgi:hypothetical protein
MTGSSVSLAVAGSLEQAASTNDMKIHFFTV